jgi:hypothetical protein
MAKREMVVRGRGRSKREKAREPTGKRGNRQEGDGRTVDVTHHFREQIVLPAFHGCKSQHHRRVHLFNDTG